MASSRGWTKKSAAPLNFERWFKAQSVALYRYATLARTALRGPLCEKPLRVYIPRPLLPKLEEGELEAPLPSWERGWGEGSAKEYQHPA